MNAGRPNAPALAGFLLRAPTQADLGALMAIHGDPRTNEHNPLGPLADVAAGRELLGAWLEDWRRRGVGYWALEEESRRRIVGFAGIRAIKAAGAELFNLYYRLAAEAWGRGIAGAAARAAVAWAHQDWPEVAVIARMQPGHVPSERTALSAGLQPTGRDPWGRTVLVDRSLSPELLAGLPPGGRAADSER